MESNGYATAASSIAQDPDKETYVFRRFDRLTARNLLNLQGELLALQISSIRWMRKQRPVQIRIYTPR
jgi:hypothetical protein